MQSKATTVQQYLAELPEDRRKTIEAVRKVILKNLDKVYEEGMQYGMIGYYVPHRVYPKGYHCDPRQPLTFAALASQKNYISIYLMTVYGKEMEENWFREEWAKTGKKLNMGKSCIRFKRVEDVPLELIGEAIRRVPAKKYIEYCESVLQSASQQSSTKKTKSANDSSSGKTKGVAKKKAVAKKSIGTKSR